MRPASINAAIIATAIAVFPACGPSVEGAPDGAPRRAATSGALGPRYGISLSLPRGWNGRVGRGVVHATTVPALAERSVCWGACPLPRAQDVHLALFETGRENRSPPTDVGHFPKLAGELRLDAAEFEPFDGIREDSRASGHGFARRTFQLSERLFALFVETGSWPPTAAALAGLNDVLASLTVQPGDFYPGTVEPARFPARPGWHTGTSGPDEIDADGEFTTSFAATIGYADEWNALPPVKTLEHLPRDGVVIWLGLTRSNRLRPLVRPCCAERKQPFRLSEFDRRESWEGQVDSDVPEYVLWGAVGDRQQIDLRVYFGRQDPTESMLAETQAMLEAVDLPSWGPWETE